VKEEEVTRCSRGRGKKKKSLDAEGEPTKSAMTKLSVLRGGIRCLEEKKHFNKKRPLKKKKGTIGQ